MKMEYDRQANKVYASFDKYLLMRKRRRLTNRFCFEPMEQG